MFMFCFFLLVLFFKTIAYYYVVFYRFLWVLSGVLVTFAMVLEDFVWCFSSGLCSARLGSVC